jgi:hypothetical protein
VDRKRLSAARHLAIANAHRDGTGLCVGIGANPVFTGTKYSERHAGGIDLDILALPEIPHAGRERTFRELNLRRLVIQIQKLERRIGVQTQRHRSDMNLRLAALANPDIVPRGKRTIDAGIHPVSDTRRLKRYGAANVTEPARPAWRIRLGSKKCCRDTDRQNNSLYVPHVFSSTW